MKFTSLFETLNNEDGLFFIGAGEGIEAASNYPPSEGWIPPKELVQSALKSLPTIERLCKILNLGVPTFWFSDADNSPLAVFLSGTCDNPAIVIFDGHPPNELLMTLYHEIGHAYIESVVGETNEEDEDAVEDFAVEMRDFPNAAIEDLRRYANSLLEV